MSLVWQPRKHRTRSHRDRLRALGEPRIAHADVISAARLPVHATSVVQLQVNVTTARSVAGSCTVLIFVTVRLFPSDWHFSLAASAAFS